MKKFLLTTLYILIILACIAGVNMILPPIVGAPGAVLGFIAVLLLINPFKRNDQV